MLPDPTDAELARNLAGASNDAERQRIDAWASESPANGARLEELRTVWAAAGPAELSDSSALWARVRARTIAVDLPSEPIAPRRAAIVEQPRRLMHTMRSVATAAGLIIAVGGAVLLLRQSSPPGASTPATAAAHEYSTGRGKQATVQLADGSHIMLAPQSRVRIRPGFGGASREIDVEGEAMIDVAHDASRPFRVHIGNAVAEDIGTRFDIRSYAGEQTVMVAVAEGAVSLGSKVDSAARRSARAAEGVVLHAGVVGHLDAQGRVTTRQPAQLVDVFAWTSGTLTFDGAGFDDVRHTLERWYDVRIQVDGASLLNRRVTARFNGQAAHAVISDLATTLGANVEWRGNVAVLTARP